MRWDEQRVENDLRLPGVGDGSVLRTFDAPEAMGINFHEVRARSALNHVPGSRYGFNWTVNVFRGCSHACTYCFARRTHKYLDFNAAEDFEREIIVKVNVPELLRAELARPSWKRELVALGTNTDPYQWVESRYRMMPEILEALEAAQTPVSILTKSPLVLRDIEIYERMAKTLPVSVNLSIPTLDEKAWRATEPHTPSPSARLDAGRAGCHVNGHGAHPDQGPAGPRRRRAIRALGLSRAAALALALCATGTPGAADRLVAAFVAVLVVGGAGSSRLSATG